MKIEYYTPKQAAKPNTHVPKAGTVFKVNKNGQYEYYITVKRNSDSTVIGVSLITGLEKRWVLEESEYRKDSTPFYDCPSAKLLVVNEG
jgi:hypothetical protein